MDDPATTPPIPAAPKPTPRRRWQLAVLVPIAIIAALITLWQWDWMIPIVASRLRATLGRSVTIAHLHVSLGRITRITATGTRIANPTGFPAPEPFATVERLQIDVDVPASLRARHLLLPLVALDRPAILATVLPDGRTNYGFDTAAINTAAQSIGNLTIANGRAHIVVPHWDTDTEATFATQPAGETPPGGAPPLGAPPLGAPGPPSRIAVAATGTYAGLPLTASFVGGSLMSLDDPAHPFPLDLRLTVGPTSITLRGIVRNPITLTGADLRLTLRGPDLGLLYPLTGIPMAPTPPYTLAAHLEYDARKIHLTDITGTIGTTDIDGSAIIDPRPDRAGATFELHSKSVDLADLGGFIGAEPGRAGAPNMSAQQSQAMSAAAATPLLLPTRLLDLPKLRSADIAFHFRGDHVKGTNMPFDTVEVTGNLDNGHVTLHPLTFGVGTGAIVAIVDLLPQPDDVLGAKADIEIRQLDLARLLAATRLASGTGRLNGRALVTSRGNSTAALLGAANGTVDLAMKGGTVSALLVNLAGLQFGNALLSVLAGAKHADIRCLIGAFTVTQGQLQTRIMLIDTSEAIVRGTGTIDLAHERLAYLIWTHAKHFSIAALPAPLGITGSFRHPAIAPDMKALAARGGVAAGLGAVFPPLALLPTIQLGVDDDPRCGAPSP